ncbi:MAG: hypothetical protein QXD62_00325 [Candidatus Woesearchaeota archaeon]
MKKNAISVVVAVVCFLFILLMVGLIFVNVILRNKFLKTQITIKELEKNYTSIKEDLLRITNELTQCSIEKRHFENLYKEYQRNLSSLKQTYDDLYQEYTFLKNKSTYLETEISSLKKSLYEIKKDVQEGVTLIDEYFEEIKKSIEWYNQNADLSSANIQNKKAKEKVEEIKQKINQRCVRVSNECRIKLGCFWLINTEYFNLKYLSENETDKLLSLEEFILNGGGDCEDFALIFKAQYNYAKTLCQGKKIISETYEIDPEKYSKNEIYWLDFPKKWYMERSVQKDLTEDKMIIVCGRMYDLNSEEFVGHCVVALTEKEIQEISDIEYLFQKPMVEPQTGSFYGILGKDVKIPSYQLISPIDSYITTVITDSDFFVYSELLNRWLSLKYFQDFLNNKRKKMIDLWLEGDKIETFLGSLQKTGN